jgi:hypothetical protein
MEMTMSRIASLIAAAFAAAGTVGAASSADARFGNQTPPGVGTQTHPLFGNQTTTMPTNTMPRFGNQATTTPTSNQPLFGNQINKNMPTTQTHPLFGNQVRP